MSLQHRKGSRVYAITEDSTFALSELSDFVQCLNRFAHFRAVYSVEPPENPVISTFWRLARELLGEHQQVS